MVMSALNPLLFGEAFRIGKTLKILFPGALDFSFDPTDVMCFKVP